MEKVKTGIILVLFITLLVYIQKSISLEGKAIFNENLNSELVKWKNKDSLNVARNNILESSIKELSKVESNDSLIIELQEDVRSMRKYLKSKGSVTNFNTYTTLDTILVPIIDTIRDTVYYVSTINDKWIKGTISSSKFNTVLDLRIRNDYSVTLGFEKQGFLKKRKPFVQVLNKNPYTETQSIKTFQVTLPRDKKFSLGPTGIVTLNGRVYLGLGITYGLLKF